LGHIVPHLAALCYLLPIREGHFLMNTLHHANLSGWDFLRLAEQASGQPAKKKQGGKYQLPCPLRDHAFALAYWADQPLPLLLADAGHLQDSRKRQAWQAA